MSGPLPARRSQRGNVGFGQTYPIPVCVHPLIALDAAMKPFVDFDPRVIA
jgi:hypothetical protein